MAELGQAFDLIFKEAKAKAELCGERIFHVSKVRMLIFCECCERPRLLYSVKAPSSELRKAMEAYAESISY